MCITRHRGSHTWLWFVPSLSSSAMGKGGQEGKDRAIVPKQPLRHLHQGQMFWLAIASARRGRKVRIWCGGQDRGGAEAGQRYVLGAGRAMLLINQYATVLIITSSRKHLHPHIQHVHPYSSSASIPSQWLCPSLAS